MSLAWARLVSDCLGVLVGGLCAQETVNGLFRGLPSNRATCPLYSCRTPSRKPTPHANPILFSTLIRRLTGSVDMRLASAMMPGLPGAAVPRVHASAGRGQPETRSRHHHVDATRPGVRVILLRPPPVFPQRERRHRHGNSVGDHHRTVGNRNKGLARVRTLVFQGNSGEGRSFGRVQVEEALGAGDERGASPGEEPKRCGDGSREVGAGLQLISRLGRGRSLPLARRCRAVVGCRSLVLYFCAFASKLFSPGRL